MAWRRVSSSLKDGARSFWRASFSKKYLFYTNTLTGGLLLAGGDAIEQKLETKLGKTRSGSYDHARTGRMFTVGILEGPPHHYFYTWLDRIYPKKTLRSVGTKILADQIIAAPMFAVIFFYGMGILQGKNLGECWLEFKKKFPAVYLFDWCIWPPTQYVNFVWVPQHLRVVYINVITVIWDVFLSYMKHFDELEKPPPSTADEEGD